MMDRPWSMNPDGRGSLGRGRMITRRPGPTPPPGPEPNLSEPPRGRVSVLGFGRGAPINYLPSTLPAPSRQPTPQPVRARTPSPIPTERSEVIIEVVESKPVEPIRAELSIAPATGNGDGNGKKVPKAPDFAPSSKLSLRSAPVRSARRIRRLAMERAKMLLDHERMGKNISSDDTRLPDAPRRDLFGAEPRIDVIPEENDNGVIRVPQRPSFSGLASIQKTRVDRFPVYTVQNIYDDRLILRSLGVPSREVIVFKKGSKFNEISLTEFAVEWVIAQGDNVVVEDMCAYYDKNSGSSAWRAMVISFPRDTKELWEKNSRWITHGSIAERRGNEVIIDTEMPARDGGPKNTIKIKASVSAFGYIFSEPDMGSTVVVRARLAGYAQHCWSLLATSWDTPWTAESVDAAGGVLDGYGHLKIHYRPTCHWTICAPKYGYVYIPRQLVTEELVKLGEKTKVYFETILNKPANDDNARRRFKSGTRYQHKWIATSVKASKNQDWKVLAQPIDLENLVVHDESSAENSKPPSTNQSECGAGGHAPGPDRARTPSGGYPTPGAEFVQWESHPAGTIAIGSESGHVSVGGQDLQPLYACSICQGELICRCPCPGPQ